MSNPLIEIITELNENNTYQINRGFTQRIKRTLGSGQKIRISLIMVTARPDFTLRGWVSKQIDVREKLDLSLISVIPILKQGVVIYVQDESIPITDVNTYTIAPGEFYMNIQNLENAVNVYSATFSIV